MTLILLALVFCSVSAQNLFPTTTNALDIQETTTDAVTEPIPGADEITTASIDSTSKSAKTTSNEIMFKAVQKYLLMLKVAQKRLLMRKTVRKLLYQKMDLHPLRHHVQKVFALVSQTETMRLLDIHTILSNVQMESQLANRAGLKVYFLVKLATNVYTNKKILVTLQRHGNLNLLIHVQMLALTKDLTFQETLQITFQMEVREIHINISVVGKVLLKDVLYVQPV
nr:uncharacterized protein LOC124817230 [Hydra vulgaris]